MDISRLAKKYRYENGNFIQNSGRYVGDAVDQKRIHKELIDAGVELSELQSTLQALAVACAKKTSMANEDSENEILDIIEENKQILQSFKIVKIRGQAENFIYHIDGLNARMIQAGMPKTSEWIDLIRNFKTRELATLHKQLAHRINPKKPNSVSIENTAERVVNQLVADLYQNPESTLELNTAPKPISLSNDNTFSYKKLEYSFIEKPQINNTLLELLSRCSDHEYLCAILWLMFNGRKTPYVAYLYGEGGEGKSSFTGMLTRLLGEEVVATFDDNSNFSNYGMYGKALIILSENVNCRLLQKSEVKALTGDSYVSCEPKGKNRFSAKLSGLLMVDSNTLPCLDGDSYELRRLRLFKFKKIPDGTPIIDKETYEEMLSENLNEFLNYCRICYESVGQNYLVPASPNQTAEFSSLKDLAGVTVARELWKKVKKEGHFELGEGEIEESSFFNTLSSVCDLRKLRQSYGDRDLFTYLRSHHNVKREGGKIKGIVFVEPSGTYFSA